MINKTCLVTPPEAAPAPFETSSEHHLRHHSRHDHSHLLKVYRKAATPVQKHHFKCHHRRISVDRHQHWPVHKQSDHLAILTFSCLTYNSAFTSPSLLAIPALFPQPPLPRSQHHLVLHSSSSILQAATWRSGLHQWSSCYVAKSLLHSLLQTLATSPSTSHCRGTASASIQQLQSVPSASALQRHLPWAYQDIKPLLARRKGQPWVSHQASLHCSCKLCV